MSAITQGMLAGPSWLLTHESTTRSSQFIYFGHRRKAQGGIRPSLTLYQNSCWLWHRSVKANTIKSDDRTVPASSCIRFFSSPQASLMFLLPESRPRVAQMDYRLFKIFTDLIFRHA